MKRNAGSPPIAYRLAVTSRVLAAVVGGYVLAALVSVCMALLLPMAPAEAVVSGMLSSFVVYLLAVLWCFACRTPRLAWLGLMLPASVLATLAALAYWLGRL
ncbi:DUF3649 domain-containing protein [Pseudomonas putida]|jgi:hypothetical protein|uniref:DUF3649 domain-containing protein n=1 Tax=Pseudomonas putida TaxID=303 RepID=UPI0023636025|nr:DUF3649 domain-containing protein [Pseudomonas putida]MDD2054592.1 DUF3649 domain-containing protein [Pseudomonas putida]